MKSLFILLALFMLMNAASAPENQLQIQTHRDPILSQVLHPHSYYWREMYMPQLTSGPSAASFSPDADAVIYSMMGSLWRQDIDKDTAYQITQGPGYDYQPDWSRDGRYVIFTRQHNDALNLILLDLETGKENALTNGIAVNVEPRWSPDGTKIAFISSKEDGYFGLYVANFQQNELKNIKPIVVGHKSKLDRYYYSKVDHAINPSWSADGRRLYYVSNDEVAWGSGDLWSVAVDNPKDRKRILVEETTWAARPELAHDGKRLLYSSYQGRQWHQLWLTTTQGLSPLPLTFGDYDIKMARWSADDKHIIYTSNETGGLTLWYHTVIGGARKMIVANKKIFKSPMVSIEISLHDEKGDELDGRVMVLAVNDRHYAPSDSLIHGDDFFDRKNTSHENHYFHCYKKCTVEVPQGHVKIMASSGFSHRIDQTEIMASGTEQDVNLTLSSFALPDEYGKYVNGDLHAHMNYGGQYKVSVAGLAKQAKAEGVDIVYNLLVNKEQRIPDMGQFKTTADVFDGVTIYQGQEFHSSYWGHMSFLHQNDHFLTPDFTSYRHTALASPYPTNGVMSGLAHQQGAVVGYVHPFYLVPDTDPDAEEILSHSLPLDVIAGRTDFLEVVSFANHQQTANVWYKFLNLGYHLAAGAGTDVMTNYASLRGPVGLNRTYLKAQADDPEALKYAIKTGNGFVTNGPQLGFLVTEKNKQNLIGPGEVVQFSQQGGTAVLRLSLRSFVPVNRLEVVQNGDVIQRIDVEKNPYQFDGEFEVAIEKSGWILLRAIDEKPNPFVQDVYTYATTNPVWIEVQNKPQYAAEDARYFLRWIERIKDDVEKRSDDFNELWEKDYILQDIEKTRKELLGKIQ